MLLTFKNKAGNNVVVKAIDIKCIVEMEKDGETICQLMEVERIENLPQYYYSIDSIEELKQRWYNALREWYPVKTSNYPNPLMPPYKITASN